MSESDDREQYEEVRVSLKDGYSGAVKEMVDQVIRVLEEQSYAPIGGVLLTLCREKDADADTMSDEDFAMSHQVHLALIARQKFPSKIVVSTLILAAIKHDPEAFISFIDYYNSLTELPAPVPFDKLN